jgi:uncharacterized damage-inducible protein DinB
MLKLFPLKIPTDSDIGTRFKAEAEKAGLTYWELLGRMLKSWESQPSAQLSLFPASSDSAECSEERGRRIEALEAEVAELKDMVTNMVSISKTLGPLSKQEHMDTIEASIDGPHLVSDVEAFEAVYAELEQYGHALIWQLREALDWTTERFDAVLRQLRDEERYQPMQGAETGKMAKKQLQSAFVDENGFKCHTVMRAPARAAEPMGATEPEPEPEAPVGLRRRGRSPKATTPEAVMEPMDKPEPEPALVAPRRRGRPPKATVPEPGTKPKRGPGRPKKSV